MKSLSTVLFLAVAFILQPGQWVEAKPAAADDGCPDMSINQGATAGVDRYCESILPSSPGEPPVGAPDHQIVYGGGACPEGFRDMGIIGSVADACAKAKQVLVDIPPSESCPDCTKPPSKDGYWVCEPNGERYPETRNPPSCNVSRITICSARWVPTRSPSPSPRATPSATPLVTQE